MGLRSGRPPTRLPLQHLLAYGSLGIPVYMLMMPMIVYLPPFYAGELGIGLSAIGAVFFIARIWDGVSDLVVGALSDRTKHRWGRRKIWIAAGIPLLLISTAFLCRPATGVGTAYLAVWLILFYMAWTMVQVPFLSWGAELSAGYHERSRVTAFREGGGMIGVMLAVGLPFLLFGQGELPFRDVLTVFLVSILILLPLTGGAALLFVPDGGRADEKQPQLREIWRTVAANKPFQRLMVVMLFIRTSACVFDAAEFWLLAHWCKQPEIFLMVVFLQYICSILSIPIVLRVARRIGKHRTLAIAIFTNLAFLAILAFAPAGPRWPIIVAFLINAVGNAANWVIPPSMIADTVDYGELKGAPGQSGTYMAIFTLAFKLSLAAGVVIALPLLELGGFSPNHANDGPALTALVLVACGLPALLHIPGLLLLWKYPIDEERHSAIRRIIERRRPSPQPALASGASSPTFADA